MDYARTNKHNLRHRRDAQLDREAEKHADKPTMYTDEERARIRLACDYLRSYDGADSFLVKLAQDLRRLGGIGEPSIAQADRILVTFGHDIDRHPNRRKNRGQMHLCATCQLWKHCVPAVLINPTGAETMWLCSRHRSTLAQVWTPPSLSTEDSPTLSVARM